MKDQAREFTISVAFDGDGEPSGVWYRCGQCPSHAVALGDTVENLLNIHLDHQREAHQLKPPRTCSEVMSSTTGHTLRCSISADTAHTEHTYTVVARAESPEAAEGITLVSRLPDTGPGDRSGTIPR